jgi:predicted ATPase
VAVAETVTPTFASGVVFTDLNAASVATEVMPIIARSLGLRDLGTRARLDRVARFILDRQLLPARPPDPIARRGP